MGEDAATFSPCTGPSMGQKKKRSPSRKGRKGRKNFTHLRRQRSSYLSKGRKKDVRKYQLDPREEERKTWFGIPLK